jgi:serine/threonine protein kinase
VTKDPVYPTYLSDEALDLLAKLLEKNPNTRLSSIKELKSHPFFKQIDWKKLKRKQIKPPYIPKLSGDTDMTHFETSDLQLEV